MNGEWNVGKITLPAAVCFICFKTNLSFQQKWLNILFCCEQLELCVQHLDQAILRVNCWKGPRVHNNSFISWFGRCNSPPQGASWTLRLGDAKFQCPQWIFFHNASLDEFPIWQDLWSQMAFAFIRFYSKTLKILQSLSKIGWESQLLSHFEEGHVPLNDGRGATHWFSASNSSAKVKLILSPSGGRNPTGWHVSIEKMSHGPWPVSNKNIPDILSYPSIV